LGQILRFKKSKAGKKKQYSMQLPPCDHFGIQWLRTTASLTHAVRLLNGLTNVVAKAFVTLSKFFVNFHNRVR